MDAVLDNLDLYFKAFGYTVALFLVSGVTSMILGTLLAAFRVGPVPVLRWATSVYVTLVRNTPLVIVFAAFSFMAPMLWGPLNFRWLSVHIGGFDFTAFFAAAVVSLSLYTSSFVCEALRSGVNAVSVGQAEAARAIGLPFSGVMSQVVLPQAFRASVPPLASVQIALIKNTSVAAVFGVAEATSQMRSITNDFSSQRTEIFIAFAIGYVVIVEVFSFFAARLESHWRVAR
ncbi:MAG: amino acid ABC transporter permease [Nocardioides sp.]|nr:amino acid ABC transporter permease [Nocardioides sp.]